MGFFRRVLGGSQPSEPWPPPGPITAWPVGQEFTLQGSGMTFDRSVEGRVEVVGESNYQGGLTRIAGGRAHSGAKVADHTALLLPEPSNQYDPNAVRVFLVPSQGGAAALIGYLARSDAIAYRPVIERVAQGGRVMLCHASLKGGWDREISFGAVLWIGPPWRLMAEIDRDFGPDPNWPPQFTAFGDDDRPYSRTDCPNCGVVLNPLPKKKAKCPHCGEPVWVRSGPDEVRYLLAESELLDHERKWADHFSR